MTSNVRYSNRVLKQIFAKQILNKEYKERISSDKELSMALRTPPDDLLGRSFHTEILTDDSVSKLMRVDGSHIKNSHLMHT